MLMAEKLTGKLMRIERLIRLGRKKTKNKIRAESKCRRKRVAVVGGAKVNSTGFDI